MKDGKYELGDIELVRLGKIHNISDFDCGDDDLNEFIKKDAINYQEERVTNTLLLIHQDKVIGYFSLRTDAIKLGGGEKEGSGIKPLDEYPAIKIARLAVNKAHQKKGLGKIIIQSAFGYIREISNIAACRFVTVDSYHKQIEFYKHFGFIINEHSKYKKKDDYVSMRYDLLNPPPKK